MRVYFSKQHILNRQTIKIRCHDNGLREGDPLSFNPVSAGLLLSSRYN